MKRLQANAVDQFFSLANRGLAAAHSDTETVDSDPQIGRYEYAFELIRSHLGRPEGHLPNAFFWSLGRPLEIAVNLGHGSPDSWWLFQCLRDALNQTAFVAALDEEESWVSALAIAERFRRNSQIGLFAQNAYSRNAIVAQAFSRLSRKGFEYEVNMLGVSLTQESFRRACANVETLVTSLGGFNVATNIFRILKNAGKVYRGLFLYGRSVAQTPTPRDPNVPWHFLYNLALKHLTVQTTSLNPAEDWTELIELARDVGASIDVEEYYGFGLINISPYLIDRAILDNTLYDELFSFQQWSAEGAEKLFNRWIDALVDAGCKFPIATSDEWRAIAKSILGQAAPYEPSVKHAPELWSFALSAVVSVRLLGVLSIPAKEINREYSTPLDTKARNSPLFPIIDLGNNRYVIPPRGLAARALYERLFSLMREAADPQLGRKLGAALEGLTAKILGDAGNKPSIVGGKYAYPNKRSKYDLDLAVETGEHIHLVECKRKALTNLARGGGTADALLDLSESFLDMLVQMTHHEIVLHTKSSIKFLDKKELILGGREVERIAVTMLDHGSLQNPIFIRGVVRSILTTQFNSDDPTITKRLEPLNQSIKKLLSNLQQLATLAGLEFWEFLHRYSFGTWWLSVDQLAVLSENDVDLWNMFRPIRHVIFQTGEIMNEFALAEKMKVGRSAS